MGDLLWGQHMKATLLRRMGIALPGRENLSMLFRRMPLEELKRG
jgi:hypothetical protein